MLEGTEMKTSELTGAALDWAVAKCEGLLAFGHKRISEDCVIKLSTGEFETFTPSTNWAQGGPIIEREKIDVTFVDNGEIVWGAASRTELPHRPRHIFTQGLTPLIAAMRCYVASKLGDEVEIPEELRG